MLESKFGRFGSAESVRLMQKAQAELQELNSAIKMSRTEILLYRQVHEGRVLEDREVVVDAERAGCSRGKGGEEEESRWERKLRRAILTRGATARNNASPDAGCSVQPTGGRLPEAVGQREGINRPSSNCGWNHNTITVHSLTSFSGISLVAGPLSHPALHHRLKR